LPVLKKPAALYLLTTRNLKLSKITVNKKRLVGTAFAFPAFFIHLMIITLPAFTMIYFAMTDWNGLTYPNFIGFSNFIKMVSDYDFKRALINNTVWMFLFLFIPLVLGLGFACICMRLGSMQMIYRTVLFLPYVVGSSIAGRIFSAFYSPYSGIFPSLSDIGLTIFKGFAPLGNKNIALFAVAFVDNWHWWGFVLVLMMSALHQVDFNLHEAALIEGANSVQIFFKVTLPQIIHSIISYFVFIIVASFKTFDYVWVMTGGGPAGATELVATWVYKRTFVSYEAGYGSALSFAVCVGCLLVYAIQGFIRKIMNHDIQIKE
jgi:raffinose/stachyose/melibiose transport system permease protein